MERQVKNAPRKAPATVKTKQIRLFAMMLAGIFAIVGLMFFLTRFQQKEIQIVQVKRTLTAGDVLSEADMKPFTMLESAYNEMGVQDFVGKDGEKKHANIYIRWDQRDQVVGLVAGNFIKQNTYLTVLDVTDEPIVRNPWVSSIKPEQEFYTMQFDSKDVNTRLLYPGTRIRARIVITVDATELADLRAKIDAVNNTPGSGVHASLITGDLGNELSGEATTPEDSALGALEPAVDAEGNPIDPTIGNVDEEGNYEYSTSGLMGEVTIAQVVIDSITIADMRNKDGESIFEIYSSLVKLPLAERTEYLNTNLTEPEKAVEFQTRVTPADMTFILNRQDATRLAEFENMDGATIKYTILPGMEDDAPEAAKELMAQFLELNNQISTISGGGIFTDVLSSGNEPGKEETPEGTKP